MTNIDAADIFGRVFVRVRAPFFLARQAGGAGPRRIALHSADARSARNLKLQATAALKAEGVDAACEVIVHRPRRLTRFRSLEALTKRLGDGTIIYDPTQFVGRSEALVRLARRLRQQIPDKISGIFIEAARRTIYVIVDRDRYPSEPEAQTTARAETLRTVTQTFGEWQIEKGLGFDLTARIGFVPPPGAKLISIDSRTVKTTLRHLWRRGLSRTAIKVGAASLLGLSAAVPAMAQDPAVSAPNLTVIGAGKFFDAGDFNEPSPWAGVGLKAAIPIASSFGLQGDVGVGTYGYFGAGGHLFWRDPSEGLIGGFASYERNDATDMTRFGAEGEWYMNNQFTLRGQIGDQTGSVTNGLFGNLDVVFYATPNFSLTGGVIIDPVGTYGHVGFEWQPAITALPGMSVFVDGQFGTAATTQAMAGLTFHFGGVGKTLIDRDRRDDPIFGLFHLPQGGYMAPTPPPA
jgi:hypothetical protein